MKAIYDIEIIRKKFLWSSGTSPLLFLHPWRSTKPYFNTQSPSKCVNVCLLREKTPGVNIVKVVNGWTVVIIQNAALNQCLYLELVPRLEVPHSIILANSSSCDPCHVNTIMRVNYPHHIIWNANFHTPRINRISWTLFEIRAINTRKRKWCPFVSLFLSLKFIYPLILWQELLFLTASQW